MNRLKRRAERVKMLSDLGEILQEYGYDIVPDKNREQQFACNLHGADNKPSARFYGMTNSFHCFACAKSRDAIEFIKDKEQVGFKQAIEILERRLQLPPITWEDGDDDAAQGDPTVREIEALGNPTVSYEDELNRLRKFLDGLTQERDLDSDSLLKFWEVFDRISFQVREAKWDDNTGKVALVTLRNQVLERLKGLA